MEITETTNQEEKKNSPRLSNGLIGSIVILSLLTGAVSGFASSWLLLNPSIVDNKRVVVDEDSEVIDVVKEASRAVVSIAISQDINELYSNNPFFIDPFFQFRQPEGSDFRQTGAGTGFFISADGLILTNRHVVEDENARYTVVTNDGKQYDATVLSRDSVNDLALVKIDIQNAPTLKLADSSKVEIGQRVIAIGNSLGQFSNTVTTGIISGLGRNITAGSGSGTEHLDNVLQTDAAINPGNSGGPLLSLTGDVVGINTAIAEQGQLVGFAIPSNDAAQAVKSYEKFGRIVRPFLGIRYVLITPSIKEENNLPVEDGAWVSNFNEAEPAVIVDGPAAKAGVQAGDIIIKIDGKEINEQRSLASLIREYNPGDSVELEIIRDGKTITLRATLDENK